MDAITSFRGKNAFLSNFHPCFVTLDNWRYPSVENAFQAAKTTDIEERRRFRSISAADAKHFGRRVTLREDWESIKGQIMLELLRQKFKHPELKELLLNTADAELIEGNNHGDRFWGQVNGVGKNMLGKLLMQVRSEIQ